MMNVCVCACVCMYVYVYVYVCVLAYGGVSVTVGLISFLDMSSSHKWCVILKCFVSGSVFRALVSSTLNFFWPVLSSFKQDSNSRCHRTCNLQGFYFLGIPRQDLAVRLLKLT